MLLITLKVLGHVAAVSPWLAIIGLAIRLVIESRRWGPRVNNAIAKAALSAK